MSSNQQTHRCSFPWQQMIIDPTGDVTPCCYYHSYALGRLNQSLGNTNTQSVEDIWNGEKYQELRRYHVEGVPEGHPCHNCVAYQFNGQFPRFDTYSGIIRGEGHCFIAKLGKDANEAVEGREDTVEFFEDGARIASEQSLDEDIRTLGGGRFSLKRGYVYFSTSDNEDPILTSRRYELRVGNQAFCIPAAGYDPKAKSGKNLRDAYSEYMSGDISMQAKPQSVGYASSADCNIDCSYCSQNEYRAAKLQLKNDTLAEIHELVPYVSYLIWAGGEPFFLKHFREFIDNFENETNPNLLFGFTTNGTMITDKEFQKLEKFSRVQASVSIDSFVPESYERLRAGAKYDRVIQCLLKLVEKNNGTNWLVQTGMLVLRTNFGEIDKNVAFAIEHGIELNLSPILQYPVTERLDIFSNFKQQTVGWRDAIDRAIKLEQDALENNKVHYSLLGPLNSLKETFLAAEAQYENCVTLEVTINDPTDSLQNMRNPGFLIGSRANPVAYLLCDQGSGRYTIDLSKTAYETLVNDASWRVWYFYHDIVEPWRPWFEERMEMVEPGMLSRTLKGDSRPRFKPFELTLPKFRKVERQRNGELASFGQVRDDGIFNTNGDELYEEIKRREVDLISKALYAPEKWSLDLTKHNVRHDSGFAYVVDLPEELVSDDDLISRIALFENGRFMADAHSTIDIVRGTGLGYYVHTNNKLYFSASDCSDPRTNGMTYQAKEMDLAEVPKFEAVVDDLKVDSGFAFSVKVPGYLPSDRDTFSPLVVLEDGKPLGQGHAVHDEIREIGEGRYSHWGNWVRFSSSDGSDPRTNGREYSIIERRL